MLKRHHRGGDATTSTTTTQSSSVRQPIAITPRSGSETARSGESDVTIREEPDSDDEELGWYEENDVLKVVLKKDVSEKK